MTHVVRLVCLVVCLVVIAGTARAQGDQSAALVKQGQQLASQGRCQEAIPYFDRARQANPKNHRAWYELGGCYGDLRQPDRAIAAFDEAIKLAPGEGVYWARRSHAKRDKGDFAGALSDIDTTLTIDFDNAFAYVIRGSVFLHMGRVRDARLDFDHAQLEVTKRPKIAKWKPQVDHFTRQFLAERPNWVEQPQPKPRDADGVSLRRALEHMRARQWRRALAYLDVAVDAVPKDPVVRLARGEAFYYVSQFARAMEDLGEAIKLSPSLAEAYMWRGRVLNYRFEHGQAVADETRAIQLRPDWAEPYYWRARFYQFAFFHDRWQDALKDWDTYLRLEKNTNRLALAHRFVGSVYFRRGDHPRALPEFQKALDLDPKLALAYCDIAQIARAANQRAQMEQYLAKCRAFDPDLAQWTDTDMKTADRVDVALREAAAAAWSSNAKDPIVSAYEAAARGEQAASYERRGMQYEAGKCRSATSGSSC